MFSFEWALTHRSFPRILPDSSIFPGASQILSKICRKNELSSVKCLSPRSSNSFIIGSTPSLFILPEYLNNSQWWFSSSFSTFEDRRRASLQSYPFSWRIMVLACCHPFIIVFDCQFFSPIRSNSGVFSVWFTEGHHFGFIHSQLSAIVLQILPVHHSNIL